MCDILSHATKYPLDNPFTRTRTSQMATPVSLTGKRVMSSKKTPPNLVVVGIVVGGLFLFSAGVVVLGALAFVGVMTKGPQQVPQQQPIQQSVAVVSNKPAIAAEWTKICADYKDNMVAADTMYKGNRIVFECGVNGRVQKIDGKPCVGYSNVANIRGAQPESTFLMFFRDTSEIAKFDGKSAFRVEGTVAGRVDDGINRLIRGYEFHVEVVDCVVLDKIKQ